MGSYDWSDEIKELVADTVILSEKDLNAISHLIEYIIEKKYPYYPYPKAPTNKDDCIAAGGTWDDEQGVCILPKEYLGAGVVFDEGGLRERYEKVAESLRSNRKVKEQWVAPLVKGTHELVGHVREFLPVTQVITNKPGDTVYAALVRDFDLGDWGTYGSPTLADETGTDIISFDSATVKEAGVKFYLKQHLTEKADSNVIEKINQVSRTAVLRAEDKLVLNAIYGTSNVLSIDKSSESVDFDADWIVEIINEFTANDVHVDPGDVVLFISPEMYEALLKDVAGAMAITFSRPDVIQKGRLTEFMGVTIRVVSKSILPNDGSNVFAIAFKKNGGHIFAPKREFLMETEPDVANRRTLVAVTTACAYALCNPYHGLKVKTPVAVS